MKWIKRNLFFVIAVAAGLGLTGYCGYLLYTSLNANDSATAELQSTRDQLTQLQQTTPYPSRENIKAAIEDQERVKRFLADFRKSFAPFPAPPVLDTEGFKRYLEDTIARFRIEASNAGVELPPEFGFTFSGLLNKLTFAPANIEPWLEQLQQIGTILRILDDAKINYLSGLCRVPVSPDDVGTGDCMLPTTPVTNEWGVVTPYKITFRGFSTEIAAVMEGFARSSNCFIIKAIDVQSDRGAMVAENNRAAAPTPMQYMPAPVPRYDPNMYRGSERRGGSRFSEHGVGAYYPTPQPVMQPVAVPAAPQGPVTILAEVPLLVTMTVDAVKLKVSEH